jgi:hypothetical protein
MRTIVSDLTVTLAAGATSSPAHNIVLQDGSPATPFLVMPLSGTPIVVTSITNTVVNFSNPSAVEQTAIFRCTRDPMINATEPTPRGWSGAADTSALQTVFVWREGAATLGNVYGTWAALYADLILTEGPKIIQLDSSANGGLSFSLPAGGPYDVSDVTWVSLGYTFFFEVGTLAIPTGASITARVMTISDDTNIVLTSAGVAWDVATDTRLYIENGGSLSNNSGGTPMTLSAGDLVVVGSNGTFGSTGFLPIISLALGTTLTFYGHSGFVVAEDTLDDGGLMIPVEFNALDSGVLWNNQTNLSGATTYTSSAQLTWVEAPHRVDAAPGNQQADDCIIVTTSTAPGDLVNLRSAASQEGKIIIVKSGAGSTFSLSVVPTGGDTIDGSAAYALGSANNSVTLVAASALGGWLIIAKS